MASQAQIKANRKNAQKSTGPKTSEGKTAVSQNAVKHGLFAESLITGEDPAEYQAFRDNMLTELAPVGAVEFMLAERVVNLWWRLRRAERMQNEVIEDMIEDRVTNPWAVRRRRDHCYNEGLQPGDPRFEPDHLALGRIASSDWSSTRVLDRMLIYERRIESSLNRAMRELKRFQVVRRIERQDAEQRLEPDQAIPIPINDNRDEAATRPEPAEKHRDLEKQSQFVAAQIDARSFLERDYGKMSVGGDEENKANQGQLEANEPVRGEIAAALRASQ